VKGEDEEEGPQLCTELAKPLPTVIQDLTPIEISAGLHSILDALSFLHEKVNTLAFIIYSRACERLSTFTS